MHAKIQKCNPNFVRKPYKMINNDLLECLKYKQTLLFFYFLTVFLKGTILNTEEKFDIFS